MGDSRAIYSCLRRNKKAFILISYIEIDQVENGKICVAFDHANEMFGVLGSDGRTVLIYRQKTLEKMAKICLKNATPHSLYFNEFFKN